eukprot:3968022-Amphidinium_carterae.2
MGVWMNDCKCHNSALRYYLNWQYADADSYGSKAYLKAAEDWLRCRRIRKMDPANRPRALRDWFTP